MAVPRPLTRWLVVAGVLVGLAAVVLAVRPGSTRRLAAFTDGGVAVTIDLRTPWVGGTSLRVRLAPEEAGFHLYSVNLPDGGIQGLGTPTRLAVRGGLRAAGPLSARPDQTWLDLPELGLRLPVYPPGPVDLELPVRVTGTAAQVVLSFGACRPDTCLVPVVDRAVDVAAR